jgi:hypothetical protein
MFQESNFNHIGRWMYRVSGLTVQQPSCFYLGWLEFVSVNRTTRIFTSVVSLLETANQVIAFG